MLIIMTLLYLHNIVCMSYNVYRFLLLPFFQLLLCFCALIYAVAAKKKKHTYIQLIVLNSVITFCK